MSDDQSDPAANPSLVLLRATRREAAGASRIIAGLTVVDRCLKQLCLIPGLGIVVVSDGAVPLPANLPANVEVRITASASGSDADATIAELPRHSGASAVAVIGADVVRRQRDKLTDGLRVFDEPTRRHAEDEIFADLLRGDLGFIARHINKKISFRITRHVLCNLPITPNQVTLGAALIGFLGCLLISTGSYGSMVAGFLLAQVQSILDGCDGELARVRFQQSAIGEWLDTLADDFLNFALVCALGLGLWRAGYGLPPAIVGAVTAAMLLVYNAVSYRELVRQGVGGELMKIKWRVTRGIDMKSLMAERGSTTGGRAARVLLALGRRDVFVFGWMVLAIVRLLPLGLLWAFLIAASCFGTAVGQLITRDPDPDPTAGKHAPQVNQ